MKDWLARWCGCHVVLFLSHLQKDKRELPHVGRAKELVKSKIVVCLRGPSFTSLRQIDPGYRLTLIDPFDSGQSSLTRTCP
jgi:hypothetical protein